MAPEPAAGNSLPCRGGHSGILRMARGEDGCSVPSTHGLGAPWGAAGALSSGMSACVLSCVGEAPLGEKADTRVHAHICSQRA